MKRLALQVCFVFFVVGGAYTIAAVGTEIPSQDIMLPEDSSERFDVRQLRISGNSLIPTDQLLQDMPAIYNASGGPLREADPNNLYDFITLQDIIAQPGATRQVSKRTMRGFTHYILSVYHRHYYAGIYVYIAAEAIEDTAQLRDGILPIEIVEAKVSEILITGHDEEGKKVEQTILDSSILQSWSPVKTGQPINKKKIDDFVNLLNRNPDRYVSAVISRGSEPNSVALGYELYESGPWHYYIMADNAGTNQRQWAPKVGVINTNLTARDDKFAAMYQGPWEKGIEDNYAWFASYEAPLFSPRLRFGFFGGRNEFDIGGGEGIDFLGRGSFYGQTLRLNLLQAGDWLLDVTNSFTHEESRVTPSIFETQGSDLDMDLWEIGVDLYHSDDTSSSSVGFSQVQSIGGASQRRFWDPSTSTGARTNAQRHFNIYNITGAHAQYLDADKVHRLSGSFRWIDPDSRLAASKLTVFGGLYSVRGYEEDEIVADGGVLASAQYEFDLIKYIELKYLGEKESKDDGEKGWLTRASLLCFTDFGRAEIENPVPGDEGTQELFSVGIGAAFDCRDNISAAIYYAWALRETERTDDGQGRWNFSFIKRW